MAYPQIARPEGFITSREIKKLVRVIDVDEHLDKEYVVVRFQREIVTFRSTMSQAIVKNKRGVEIITGSTFSDYHGPFASCQSALDNAKELVNDYDGMLVEVVTTIIHIPYMVAPHYMVPMDRSRFDRETKYIKVGNDWALDDEHVDPYLDAMNKRHRVDIDPYEGNLTYLKLAIPDVEVVIFSSAWTDEENAKAYQSLNSWRDYGDDVPAIGRSRPEIMRKNSDES